ncbi:endolytic transglycosylase MltG [Patescibacteria group bacterium]|nr:endolytic transglycosylase MltG [Patescibacteria group bacterium]
MLYPDTYFLSTNGDAIDQLLQASLKRFNEKIYSLWEQQGSSFLQNISSSYSASIPQVKDIYDAIILASVIEKEERAASAKPTIAGIFLNRLSQ